MFGMIIFFIVLATLFDGSFASRRLLRSMISFFAIIWCIGVLFRIGFALLPCIIIFMILGKVVFPFLRGFFSRF